MNVNLTVKSTVQNLINQRFSAFQWKVVVLCFIIALFDGFDTQAVAFTAPALLEHFNLEAGALAPILTAGIVGMTVGAMLLGWLGDRFGRRQTLLVCTALFSISTLLIAFVSDINQILVLRIIAGLGMGGATPVLLALASEYAPEKYKATVTTGVLLALPAGAMLGGILAAHILPVWGWQGIYWIGGGLPLLLVIILYFNLPESIQFLVQRQDAKAKQAIARVLRQLGHHAELQLNSTAALNAASTTQTSQQLAEAVVKVSIKELFKQGYATTTAAVWAIYFFNWIAWFMLLSWLPTILKQAGLAPEQAPYASVTVNAAFILFAIPLAYWLPRLNIKKILSFMFLAGILVVFGLGSLIDSQAWLYIFALIALAGFGVGGQQLALNYLVVAVYPTQIRATATGWAIGMGRLGAIVGSFIGGMVFAQFGISGYFYALALPLLIAAIAVWAIQRQADQSATAQLK